MVIDVDKVTKVYEGKTKWGVLGKKKEEVIALKDVSLQVEKGQIYGILGPNGAGKSTLLKIMSTVVKPTSGNITICGKHTVNDSLAVRKKIGYLTNDMQLDSILTVSYLFRYYCKLLRLPIPKMGFAP